MWVTVFPQRCPELDLAHLSADNCWAPDSQIANMDTDNPVFLLERGMAYRARQLCQENLVATLLSDPKP